MKSIRKVAAEFGLSRSALLYYDRTGLLKPEYRTSAGHRLYSEEDVARLARICELRQAGLALKVIEEVLEPNRAYRTPLAEALNCRLAELNREIAALRRQQQVVIALLREKHAEKRARIMTKERWVEILAASGMNQDDRSRWHAEFEASSPEAHQDFLESLGIPPEEIARIRAASGKRPGRVSTPRGSSEGPLGTGRQGSPKPVR